MSRYGTAILTAALLAMSSYAAVLKVPGDHKTIQEAIGAAAEGDTILLAAGTHLVENHLQVPKRLTIASAFIDSKDVGDIDRTIVKGGDKAIKQWFDIGKGAKGTRIIGLTILGNRTHSLAIRNASSEVSHCRFVGGTDQLSFEGGGGLVSHCQFEGAGDDAVDADNSVSWTVEHCTIKGANDDGIEVRLHAKRGPVTTHVARYNTFTECTTGIQFIDYAGDSHRRFEVHGNVFKNTRSTALDCTVHTSNRNADGSPMVEAATIFGNTIDGCLNGITMAPRLVVLNNIITNTKEKGIVKGKHLEAGARSIVDHCLFFGNALDYDQGVKLGKSISTFDPQYVDATSYALSPGSQAIDKGAATYTWQGVEVLKILAGTYAGKAPDLGAREHGEAGH